MSVTLTRQAIQLLSLVRTRPDNKEAWLVLADWLTENGDERGELIIISQNLENSAISFEDRAKIQRRISTLRSSHQEQWLSGLVLPKKTELFWRNGFIIGIGLPWNKHTMPFLSDLLAHPTGALLRSMDLSRVPRSPLHKPVGASGAETLAASESLRMLTVLRLSSNSIGAEGAAALAASPNLSSLKTLILNSNRLDSEGATAIVFSRCFQALGVLSLDANRIGPEGAIAIATARELRSLKTLSLRANEIGDAGVAAIASAPHLRSLEGLDLAINRVSSKGAEALAASEILQGLKELDLRGNFLGDVGIAALVASPYLRGCRVIT